MFIKIRKSSQKHKITAVNNQGFDQKALKIESNRQKQSIIEIKASQLKEIADYKSQIEKYQQLLMKQKNIMITMADR